jgi:hypothetical protein
MSDKGAQAEFQPDRRSTVRHRTRRKALVVTNSLSTQNAEILNLSANGALVQFDGIGAFPETFELRFDDRKRRVVRIWTRGLKAGVAFED